MDPGAGVLAYYEIKKLNIKPTVDGPGMGAYATYGPNNEYWLGFDTPDTLQSKVSSTMCLCWQVPAILI